MIPTEILQAHNNTFSLPVRFGLNCAIDVHKTLTVQCEGVGGVIDGSTVACVYDSGPIQEECEYIQQLLHVLTVIQNSCNNMVTNIDQITDVVHYVYYVKNMHYKQKALSDA